MNITITGYYPRIRYFTSPSERPGEVYIAGGCNNQICFTSFSGILSGANNCIAAVSDCSAIAGGSGNKIGGGHQCHGFIGGGAGNTVSAIYGAILGGAGNTVSHAYSAAFGCNVSSAMDCAFHANNFVGQNLPTASTGIPGAFWRKLCGTEWVVMIN